MTDLSIIIVTYKGWERLEKCLASLSKFSYERYSKEVVIVDNTPDKEEISHIREKYPDFKYFSNPVNGGYGYGLNRGAQIAGGKYILVLNPDTVASEKAIDELLLSAEKNAGFAIITCRQVNENGKECVVAGSFPRFLNLTGLMRSLFKQPAPLVKGEYVFPDWVSGSVMLISRQNFLDLKGFDEDFWMYYEDVDICKRAWNSAGKVVLMSNVVIEHNHGGSSRSSLKTTALTKSEVHISRHVFISKHKKGLSRAGIQFFLVLNNLITNILLAIPGLFFFFIPKIFIRSLILKRLLAYYLDSAANGTWLSRRSVRYPGRERK